MDILTRGVQEVIKYEHLAQRIARGDKLRIKLGIDPTAKDLHLGHTVVLRKLRQFQNAGHTAVLIIGDYTARIGDPSGRNEERPMITQEVIEENMSSYLEQAGKILNRETLEVCYNSDWYKDQPMTFFFQLSKAVTIAQVLKREDFRARLDADQDLSMLEAMYPLLQGYDSVAVRADVELGGVDQKLNLLMGRRVQRRYDMVEQDILTVPLLLGLDGSSKMSKSLNNYIAVNDLPDEMFGKIMSIPDALMPKYYELLTNIPFDSSLSPKQSKMKLAENIILQFYGSRIAQATGPAFDEVHSRGGVPDVMLEGAIVDDLAGTMAVHFSISKSEAHRKIKEGAVSVNGKTISDPKESAKPGDILRAGRKFLKII